MSDSIDDRHSLSTFGFLTLRRRWKLICACVVLAVAAGGAFVALRGASYTASTQFLVYVKEVQPGPEPVVSLGRADLTQVENEIEIIRSRGTLAKVVRSLNLADDPEFVPATTLAQDIAQRVFGMSRSASDERRSRQEIAIETLAKHVAIQRIGTSHTILVNVTTSDPEKSALIANDISQAMVQARLSAEQDGDRSPLLRERLQGLGPSVYVMTPALVPDKPSGPRKILVLLGAAIAGFVLGTALALLWDLKDRTIRTAAQVERFGLECIGAIPLLSRGKPAGRSGGRPVEERGGPGEFRSTPLLTQTLLRMTVAAEAAKARVVGVASPTAGEGATTVARQFAQAAARSSRKVLFVETDASGASANGASGYREISSDVAALCDGRLEKGVGEPDVLVVAASADGGGSANWWMHCDQKSLATYDLIIVGLPPLEQGAAFRLATQKIDGTLLVMKWGGADIERIERAFSVSGAVPSDFIGAVLNKVDGRMVGQFGDKLWKAETVVAARRRLFAASVPVEPVAGPA